MKFKKLIACTLGMALLAGTMFTGCGINEGATLVNINNGEDTISLGYANFAARFTQATYEKMYNGYFGDAMWTSDLYGLGTTFEYDVKEAVKVEIQENYILEKHAADYNISLTEDEVKAINDAADAFIAANDSKTLKIMSASKDNVVKYLTQIAVSKKVSAAIKEEAKVTVTKDEAWQRTFTYALFRTDAMVDENGQAQYPTAEFLEAQKQAAEDVANAESFDDATRNLDEKNTIFTSYVYTKGETEDVGISMDVISAAEALKEGETSAVIDVDTVGYYIIRLDSEYDEDATSEKMDQLKIEKENQAVKDKVTEWLESVTWDFSDSKWSKIKFDTMFTFVTPEQKTEGN